MIEGQLTEALLSDVALPMREGVEVRKRCISRPGEHQAFLLQKLGLKLPQSLEVSETRPTHM